MQIKSVFARFFRVEASSSWVFLFAVVLSLLTANSPLAASLFKILHATPANGGIIPALSVQEWINDGLMALFFLLVGLEVKRAFLTGELSSVRKAAVPVLAAIGGCLVPAVLFAAVNTGTPTAKGWAIPMATDIAFALAVLNAAAGRRAGAMRSFLSTLAIADDLCAILVIVAFYSSGVDVIYIALSVGVFTIQMVLGRMGVKTLGPYLLLGVVLWCMVHHSGVHATVAGVLTAFAIPARGRVEKSPLERLEHALLKPVNFIIVPLFALTNTAIAFSGDSLASLLTPLSAGIMLGLLLGKPLGVLLLSGLAVRLRIGVLPAGVGWRQLLCLGVVAGIGFTMSIFVTMLAYGDPKLQAQAKIAILLASATAGITGYILLKHFGAPGISPKRH